MLLILSNSRDATVDYFVAKLHNNCIPFLRIDTDTVTENVILDYDSGRPIIRVAGEWYPPEHISNVWYRRPERIRIEGIDESPERTFVLEEWAEALEGYFAHIEESRWVNHPARNTCASHKLEQLSRAASMGLSIPETLLTQDADRLKDFHGRMRGRVVVKPMATGHIERMAGSPDSVVYTNRVNHEDLSNLDDIRGCPTLFQAFIDKKIDVRITVIDGVMHPVALRASDENGVQRCDIRRNNMSDVTYSAVELPASVRSSLQLLISGYRLRFAAIDMAVTQHDEWVFFEINPNGQWAWLDMVGATNIAETLLSTFSRRP